MNKKTSKIVLGLLASVSLMMIGCGSKEMQHCADKNNVVVDDKRCEDEEQRRVRGGVGYMPYYHWMYASQHHPMGSRISSGRMAPTQGFKNVRPNSVGRGGFGFFGSGRSAVS